MILLLSKWTREISSLLKLCKNVDSLLPRIILHLLACRRRILNPVLSDDVYKKTKIGCILQDIFCIFLSYIFIRLLGHANHFKIYFEAVSLLEKFIRSSLKMITRHPLNSVYTTHLPNELSNLSLSPTYQYDESFKVFINE